jgi:hypothetical protein
MFEHQQRWIPVALLLLVGSGLGCGCGDREGKRHGSSASGLARLGEGGLRVSVPDTLQRRDVPEEEQRELGLVLHLTDSAEDGSGYSVRLYAAPEDLFGEDTEEIRRSQVEWMGASWQKYFLTGPPGTPSALKDWGSEREEFVVLPTLSEEHRWQSMREAAYLAGFPGAEENERTMGVQMRDEVTLARGTTVVLAGRGAVRGVRPRLGPRIEIRYAWVHRSLVYRIVIELHGDSHERWHPALAELLASIG